MLKKLLTSCFAILAFISISPVSFAHQYKDVPQGSAYYYPVDYLRRNDVFKDTEYFQPDILINRAEFIKYLVILNSPDFKPKGTVSLPFEDTRNNAWYAPYFKEAIILGILDDRARKAEPDKKLTMIDALTLLFHSQSIPIPNVYKGGIPYTDVVRNKQAAPLIMRALSLDIIYPQREDYVGIYQRVTRAQAARMIYKMDLVTLGSAYSNGLPQVSSHNPELDKIISVWELIETSYLSRDNLDKAEIADKVLGNLVQQLDDPYSVYMNSVQNQNFQDGLDGEIEGIGAVIGYNENNEIVIVSPIKDSPADKAGLIPKDIIVAVDDKDITGMSLENVVGLIKGPRGTEVKLKIKRSTAYMNFTITRELIEIPSVEYEIINGGNIMHLIMSQFNYNAAAEFGKAVSELMSDPSIKGLIIDLRGNPGGLLDESLRILGYFVKAQEALVTINYADYTQVLLSRGNAELNSFPIVVLIDEGSASASEIVAGALQDYELATIMGDTSFGKGTVQEMNYFIDNSSLKLTVAKWLTPDGQDIQDGGIKPDISVSDNAVTETDEQLDRAIQELNKLMK
ncbi:PDZ domain-containing protein [Patescibacteria group bacterium]|nr:PDZ domain-containing protein [Patescibacteria group bacterium]MBU1015619.1 PDZ domain-containing protein [Patescibacteria group bacterium]MBU1685328.1 PDZ domain-containing protein [Patescibacteria group bacterium]MBU1938754.1 PDZ domain-containing protein [Patescibacteria group bacterium]